MNILLRTIVFVLLFSVAAIAQSSLHNEAFLEQLGDHNFGQIEQVSFDKTNQAILLQEGTNNSAIINQYQVGFGWNANFAAVIQNGNYNSILLEQLGAGNFNNISQFGDHNSVDFKIRGFNNYIAISQTGNNNSVLQDLMGYNMNLVINQVGNGNSFTQIENNSLSSRQIQVTQQGEGARVILVNGSIYR